MITTNARTNKNRGTKRICFKTIYSAWCPANLPNRAKNTTIPSMMTVTNINVICAVRELAAPVKLPFFNAPPTAVATGPMRLTPMSDAIKARMKATITSTAVDAILAIIMKGDGIPKACSLDVLHALICVMYIVK